MKAAHKNKKKQEYQQADEEFEQNYSKMSC